MKIAHLKSEFIELFNCEINGDEITAKLVFFDRLISKRIATLTSGKGIEYKIIVPDNLRNRPNPYFNVHEGVFSIKIT